MRAGNRVVWLAALILAGVVWGTAPLMAQDQAGAPSLEDVKIDGEYGPWLPTDISTHGHRIDTLIHSLHVFAIVALGLWTVFLVYCLVRYRRKPGRRASYEIGWKHAHLYFVAAIAVFELVLDIGLSNPVLANAKNERPDEDKASHVRVVAEQFAWNFHYPGPDGLFGKTAPEHVDTATNPLGVDPADPNGMDDIASGELHVVVNRPVICYVTSKDVIHSFSVPVLRVKQDAIPGMRIPVWFEATRTGNYEVACAQLCGNNHYSMRALLVIHESGAEFDEWLESRKPEEFDEDEFD